MNEFFAQKCSGGNTGQPPSLSFLDTKKRCRWYPSFTFYPANQNKDIKPRFDPNTMKYLCFGWETCPKTGNKHWQSCVYFYNPVNYKSAQKLLKIGNSHMENIERSENKSKAIMYCKKEGDWFEFGTMPEQGARKDLDIIKNEIMNGTKVDDIAVERPMMYHQYGRTMEKLETIYLRKQYRQWMTQGIWYYGTTGVGKSRKVFEDYNPENVYVKNLNEEFWDGYKGQPIVILNEFRGQIKFDELLDLCDMHPKTVKIKGKEGVPFLAKEIRITSSLHPSEIYCQSLAKNDRFEQFERRFIIKELTKSST